MKKIDLGQMITILANVGVIIGIAFLAIEVNQNTQAGKVTAADNFVSSINEANVVAIENPSLAAVILKARTNEQLLPGEELILTLYWSNALRNWYRAYFLYEQGVLDRDLWQVQRNAIMRTLPDNPSLFNIWLDRRSDFSAEFNSILDSVSMQATIE